MKQATEHHEKGSKGNYFYGAIFTGVPPGEKQSEVFCNVLASTFTLEQKQHKATQQILNTIKLNWVSWRYAWMAILWMTSF